MSGWELLPGETPIDVSGLRQKGIRTRAELNRAEAENIRKAVVKYLAAKPSRRSAPFTLAWTKRLHKQMFGDVWKWAGAFRRENLNLGGFHGRNSRSATASTGSARRRASRCSHTAARHGFATRKLIQGKGSLTISQLMGHANGSMLARVYGNLDKNVDFL